MLFLLWGKSAPRYAPQILTNTKNIFLLPLKNEKFKKGEGFKFSLDSDVTSHYSDVTSLGGSMAKETALTDAERQRKRRQKLKAKAEEEKYAPEPFIADAIYELSFSGEISQELLAKILLTATRNVKITHPNLSIVMQKYAEKRIANFFTSTKMEAGNESL